MKNKAFTSILIVGFFFCFSMFFGATEEKHATYTKEQAEAFFEKFDEVQKNTLTIQADFSERKELRLLKEPAVSKGKFYYTRPNQILWSYQKPDEKQFLLTKNTITSYYPKEKKAEQVSIKRYSKRVFKFFTVGAPSKDLKDLYDIELSNSSNSKRVLMTLEPKKRGVKKRVEVVKLWIEKATLLPQQIQWVEVDGDTTTITFENVKTNVQINEDVYKLNIPPDIEIKEGLSEFSNNGN